MTYAMAPFDLHRPATLDEALSLAKAHPGAQYLAGGTDLVVNLRKRLHEPQHVIQLRKIPELHGIAQVGDELHIGALVTMDRLAGDATVTRRLPALAEAAGLVAGPTIRRMATVGGNICLDTRCRYYNQSFFWRQANDFCLKKDGDVCHVAPGGSFCWAAFSADTPPVLLALEAQLDLAGPDGARTVPLADFYGSDGRWSVGQAPGGLRPGELLLRVRVPLGGAPWSGVYEKLRVRDSIDYPLVGAALLVRWHNGAQRTIADIRLALTAVNPRPELVPGLDALRGQPLDVAAVDLLMKAANRTGKPMRTAVADPAYRRAMIGALVEKACLRLAPDLRPALDERVRWA